MRIPPAEELISAALQRIGAGADDLDLAITLRQRYGLRTTQSSISRWRNSPRGPSYEAAVALLDLAGWLNQDQAAEGQASVEEFRQAAERIQERRKPPSRRSTGT